jgi:hypothetical protein
MEYKCIECKKTYSGYQSLWIHNKKFHNEKQSETNHHEKNVQSKHNHNHNHNNCQNDYAQSQNNPLEKSEEINTSKRCIYCKKMFSHYNNKWRHEKKCKDKTNVLTELERLKEENEKLKSHQIVPLNSNSHNNNNTNYGTINKNNGTINNTLNNSITINKIGKESLDFTTKEIKSIARSGLNGAITCIKEMNFNKNKPQNHSFCTSSLEGNYCTAINHKTQKPEKVPKKDIMDKVLESAFNYINGIAFQLEFNNELREQISDIDQKRINYIIKNKNKFYEKKNWKIFFDAINSMSYNYKEMIMSTWKILKEPEDIIETEEEEDLGISTELEPVTFSDKSDDEENYDSDSDDSFCLKI